MEVNDTLTTFICLFHDPARAESALDALEHAGFQRSTITSTWNGAAGNARNVSSDELQRIGVPERDFERLGKGLTDGGVLLSLEAPEEHSDDIERIFHKYSADKIDETDSTPSTDYAAPVAAAAVAAPLAPDGLAEDEAIAIPVVAEELLVGKREVNRGGVRVFQRTVEEPVSQELQLHDERVVLERRVVDRAVTPEDLQMGEGTLELIETEEVPVVQKTARVVEEVHVGKVESSHTERIDDTVRHTEVEVEEVDPTELGSQARSNQPGMDRKA